MRKLVLFFFLVLFSFSVLYSQIDAETMNSNFNNTPVHEIIKSDAITFYNVGLNLFKSPFQFDNYDLFLTGVCAWINCGIVSH